MLQKLCKGTFSKSIDLLKAYSMYTQKGSSNYHFLPKLTALLTILINADIPAPLKPYFSSQYVLTLHKDPDDLNKLWPISIGTAL
jgi:hypothetical protein